MIFYFQLLIYSIICETPDRNYSRYSTHHEKRILAQSNLTSYQWDYLRVQFVYIQSTLPQEQQTFLNKVFQVAQLFFQKHLLVRRLGYKIQWSPFLGSSLFDIQIPLNLRTDSYDTDYVFFINVENSPDVDYLAYASPADKDSTTLRPILGLISWNMATVNLNSISDVDFQDNVLTAIHEMTHALGFLPDYFNTFYDSVSGETYADGNLYTQFYQYLTTPRIRQYIRQYFQCFNAVGAQLEDQGGSGSSQSHFERSIFFNEIMTAQFMSNGMLITQLTSSFYEDTGFYRLAEYKSDSTTWGGSDGCLFLSSQCTGTNFSEFCSADSRDECSFDYAGISYCSNDTFSNKCQYQQIYQYLNCRDATNPTKQADRGVFDYFGYDSMCVVGSLTQQAYTYPSACYKYSCDDQNNLYITVNSINFNCSEKQLFTQSQYFGSITCPKNTQQICQNKNTCVKQCNSKGLCHQGQCICIQGFSGQGCEQTCTTYRYLQQCLEQCPSNTYTRDDIKYCIGCPANCKTCSDYKSCLTCNEGFRIRGGFCDYLSVQFTKSDNQFVLPTLTQNSNSSLTSNQTSQSNNSTLNKTLNSTCKYYFIILQFLHQTQLILQIRRIQVTLLIAHQIRPRQNCQCKLKYQQFFIYLFDLQIIIIFNRIFLFLRTIKINILKMLAREKYSFIFQSQQSNQSKQTIYAKW